MCIRDRWTAGSLDAPAAGLMTRNPVTLPPDGSIAFALNLMSQGGFRHLPIVDQDRIPLGVISVKDVIDYLVEAYTTALLDFSADG